MARARQRGPSALMKYRPSTTMGRKAPAASRLRSLRLSAAMTSTADGSASSTRRELALDGLRGVAILLVMAHHFVLYGGVVAEKVFLDKLVTRVANAGWIGVDVFLVLSGYLITQSLVRTKGGTASYRRFLLRRALRTLPLHYAFLFAFLPVLVHVCPASGGYPLLLRQQMWYWTQLVNWPIAVRGWSSCYIIEHLWFTALIWQFYVVWPLVVYPLRGKRMLILCGGSILVTPIVRHILQSTSLGAPYVLLPARMDALALGAAIVLAMRVPQVRRYLVRWAWVPALASALAVMAVFTWKRGLKVEDPFVGNVGLSLLAVFVGALLVLTVGASPHSRLHRLLSISPLRFLGRHSYGLYVLHHPIAILLPRVGVGIGSFPTWRGSQLPGLLIFSLVVTALSIVLAVLSWRFWESRFLRLYRPAT